MGARSPRVKRVAGQPSADDGKHPAKFSESIQDAIARWVVWEISSTLFRPARILDPMAGVGTIGFLEGITFDGAPCRVTMVEIEPEWAAANPHTICADLFEWPNPERYDILITSPAYGNRMSDHHNANDRATVGDRKGELTIRHTYKHYLGRLPSVGASTTLRWGEAYRAWHRRLLDRLADFVEPGGLVLWNVADHIATVDGAKQRQRVTAFFVNEFLIRGYELEAMDLIETAKLRHGKAWESRTRGERLLVLRAPGVRS